MKRCRYVAVEFQRERVATGSVDRPDQQAQHPGMRLLLLACVTLTVGCHATRLVLPGEPEHADGDECARGTQDYRAIWIGQLCIPVANGLATPADMGSAPDATVTDMSTPPSDG